MTKQLYNLAGKPIGVGNNSFETLLQVNVNHRWLFGQRHPTVVSNENFFNFEKIQLSRKSIRVSDNCIDGLVHVDQHSNWFVGKRHPVMVCNKNLFELCRIVLDWETIRIDDFKCTFLVVESLGIFSEELFRKVTAFTPVDGLRRQNFRVQTSNTSSTSSDKAR